MAATVPQWLSDGEAGNALVTNRVLKFLLTACGINPLAAFPGFIPAINAKAYGAVGDGSTDDTAKLQDAINVFSGTGWNGSTWGSPTRSGMVYFPEGIYSITNTLTYNGASGLNITMQGVSGAALATSGATIRWNGAAGGTMLYAQGMCRSTVRELTFDGAQSGKNVLYCIQVDAKNIAQAGSPGSQSDTFENVMFRLGTFANCAAMAFGHAGSNDQVDTIIVRECFVQGAGSTTSTGILILAGGNVTHFTVEGGTYISLGYVLQAPNITGLAVRDTICLLTTVSDFNFTGTPLQAVLSHVHSEQGISSRFVTMTPAGGPGVLHLDTCSWNGVAPANDVIVSAIGTLIVTGGDYVNTRTGTSIPKFTVVNPRNGPSSANLGGLHVRGAFFLNADNTAALWPFADSGGNLLAVGLPGVAKTYYDAYAMGANFSAEGNHGGTRGTMIPLISQRSIAGYLNFTKLRSASNDALTDASADAAIGLKNSDAIKFKIHTGGAFDSDLNGVSMNVSDELVLGDTAGVRVQKFGANGNAPQAKVVLPANATDLATAQTLVNAIKTLLIANGQAS